MVRCVSLLLRPRVDSLTLARCGAAGTTVQRVTGLAGLFNSSQGTAELGPAAYLAQSFGHDAERRCLPRGRCGIEAAVAEAARDASDMLVLQVPPGRGLPAELEQALVTARCAVLLFRAAPGVPWSGDERDEAQLRVGHRG